MACRSFKPTRKPTLRHRRAACLSLCCRDLDRQHPGTGMRPETWVARSSEEQTSVAGSSRWSALPREQLGAWRHRESPGLPKAASASRNCRSGRERLGATCSSSREQLGSVGSSRQRSVGAGSTRKRLGDACASAPLRKPEKREKPSVDRNT